MGFPLPQHGPLPGGSISTISTYRPDVAYSIGQMVIEYGVLYVSLVNNNQGWVPYFSPSQWSTQIISPGTGATHLIEAQTVSGTTGSVTFSDIPTGYTNLQLVATASTNSELNQYLQAQFNGDMGTNYDLQYQICQYVPGPDGGSGSTWNTPGSNSAVIGLLPSSANLAQGAGSSDTTIYDYTGTVFFKNTTSLSSGPINGFNENLQASAMWRSTEEIASITLFPTEGSFTNGSVFNLYGVL